MRIEDVRRSAYAMPLTNPAFPRGPIATAPAGLAAPSPPLFATGWQEDITADENS